MTSQMIRVISSPSSSTTGFATLILLMGAPRSLPPIRLGGAASDLKRRMAADPLLAAALANDVRSAASPDRRAASMPMDLAPTRRGARHRPPGGEHDGRLHPAALSAAPNGDFQALPTRVHAGARGRRRRACSPSSMTPVGSVSTMPAHRRARLPPPGRRCGRARVRVVGHAAPLSAGGGERITLRFRRGGRRVAGTNHADAPDEGGPQPVFVLVAPQMGENIGAAARAMWNFGLDRLRLVAPRDGWPNPRAEAMASGAGRVLDRVRLAGTHGRGLRRSHLRLRHHRPRAGDDQARGDPEAAMVEARAMVAAGRAGGRSSSGRSAPGSRTPTWRARTPSSRCRSIPATAR